MKKIKYVLFVLVVVAFFPLSTLAKEKVNVYLFKRDGCNFCANALTFFNTLSQENEFKNYFNLVVKDVNSKENSATMEKTAKKLGVTVNGVPFIVIGEQHFEGYVSSYDDQIKSAIKTAYENESQDVVAALLASKADDNSSATTIIILLAVISGVAFLIYMARDTKDLVIEEKVIEKEVVHDKASNKKTPTKKKTTTKTNSTKKNNKK